MSDSNSLNLQVVDERGQNKTDALLHMAVNQNLDVEKLEKLMELREREEARIAKQMFDAHFAAMQKDYRPVSKTKGVSSGGRVIYKFAPLEEILKIYQPIISEHGFSYKWREEAIQGTQEKRVYCIVSGWGHAEETFVDIPIPDASGFTNSIQQRGSASSYGKRYSFCAAFGVIIEDEDDDAVSLTWQNAVDHPFITASIISASNMQDLQTEFKKLWDENKDPETRKYISNLKDKRKKELNGTAV